MRVSLLLLVQLCFTGADAANILFLFFPSYSHIRAPLNVASELASRGHVVWNAVPTRLANDKRLQVPGVNHLAYRSLDNFDVENEIADKLVDAYFRGETKFRFNKFKEICNLILKDNDIIDGVNKLKIDLIIYDSTSLPRMLTILAYKFDLPFIFMGPFFEPYASRTPFVASTFPFIFSSWTPKMDFSARLFSSVAVSMYWLYDPFAYSRAISIYAPEKPYISLEALTAKALLWLVEYEPFLHYPQAVLPNVKIIGSFADSPPKPLPEFYKKFMDDSKDGVIIVSFGSNVKHIPEGIMYKLLNVFSRTGYRYIFKTDKKSNVGPNILLTDWMPQFDLLAHPKTKLFITHCGSNGQNEGFLNGVPMIGFPIFAEQPFNAERLVYNGFGLRMDLRSFKTEELIDNINLILKNDSFSKKIKKAAAITKLRQRIPKDEAVYWIEHVLQYGGDHLRSYCQNMPLYQFLNLDVIAFLLFLFHFSLYLIWKLCCCWYRMCVKRLSGSKQRKTSCKLFISNKYLSQHKPTEK